MPFGHCERSRHGGRARQSNYFPMAYQIDITTQSLEGEGRVGGKMNYFVTKNPFPQKSILKMGGYGLDS